MQTRAILVVNFCTGDKEILFIDFSRNNSEVVGSGSSVVKQDFG